MGDRLVSAQDIGEAKYSVLRGYESWQAVSVSYNDKAMAVILADPVMIKAYQSGIPGNGKPFPDGASSSCSPRRPCREASTTNDAKCGVACHTIARARDSVFTDYARR